jgi:ribosomal protein S18 acetylase RimI-like enzyme
MDKLTVIRVCVDRVHEIVPLFDAYRQFYKEQSDLEGARSFLANRLSKDESVIFLASEGTQAVGFAQLYPCFSSLSMKPMWILNDLFVTPTARGHGVGSALLQECTRLAVETGAKEMWLETMKTNVTAQRLYEGRGWKRDDIFYRYNLSV